MKMRLPPRVSCLIDSLTKNLSGFPVESAQVFQERVAESNP
jgi:hypothetical protein